MVLYYTLQIPAKNINKNYSQKNQTRNLLPPLHIHQKTLNLQKKRTADMSFLNPAFLWAFTAISIPIIIHLIHFRRHKLLYFSNTKHLINIRKETKSKTRLKQLLILLCRILTIAMLVIVFAGPYIPFDRELQTEKAAVTAVYLDNSFSMQAESKSGQLFELSRQTALEIAESAESNMQFLLVTNEFKPEHQVILNRENFVSELNLTDISPYQISLDELVLKANTLIPDESKAILYVLSDMQKNFINSPSASLDENIEIIFMPYRAGIVNNIFIDTCYFETPVHRLGQHEKLVVRLRSFSTEDNFNIPLQLFINDTLKAFSGVNLKAGETKNVELDYVNTVGGNIRGRLEITDYPITYDNTLYFNYYIADKINILMINGLGDNRFIRALYESDPDNFEFKSVRQGEEQSLSFSQYDYIILNEISEISTGLGAEIKTFINDGGSVTFIPAKQPDYASCNNFLSMLSAGTFMPESFESARINYLDYDHHLFHDVFQRHEQQVDLPHLGFLHRYSPNNISGPAVLIRADNLIPVMTSYVFEKGNFYLFSAPLNENNIDFLRHPLFVPVFYKMALNSQLNNPLYTILGYDGAYEIISLKYNIENELIKIRGNDKPEMIPLYNYSGTSLNIFLPEELDKAGNYKVYAGDDFISGLSVNYNRKESEAYYVDHDELVKLADANYGDNAFVLKDKYENFYQAIKELSLGKMIWRYFVILALVFIVCEIMLIRFMK